MSGRSRTRRRNPGKNGGSGRKDEREVVEEEETQWNGKERQKEAEQAVDEKMNKKMLYH